MQSSNLAERPEKFAAAVESVDAPKEQPTPVVAVTGPGLKRRAPRRLSLGSRRLQVPDPGLRRFRVF